LLRDLTGATEYWGEKKVEKRCILRGKAPPKNGGEKKLWAGQFGGVCKRNVKHLHWRLRGEEGERGEKP